MDRFSTSSIYRLSHKETIIRIRDTRLSYTLLPAREERIRTLIAYMDKQKSHSLQGLWYETRHTRAWWTF